MMIYKIYIYLLKINLNFYFSFFSLYYLNVYNEKNENILI